MSGIELRVATTVRLPESLYSRLTIAARERDVGRNLLVIRALEDYLAALPEVP